MMIDHFQGAIDVQRKLQKDMNDSMQAWHQETQRIGDGVHSADTTTDTSSI